MRFRNKESVLQYSNPQNLDDDFSLIKRFIDGDESTFTILVRRHREKVRNIIYITIGNANTVDDLAQEVFINVYKNLVHFRFECRFTTWLYRIVINKCRDHLRKMKIRNIFIPIKDDEQELSYSADDFKEEKEIIRRTISLLPDRLRIPLLLKDIEGFSYQEIADFVECEVGTVKSRIFRARDSLRKLLEPYRKEFMT